MAIHFISSLIKEFQEKNMYSKKCFGNSTPNFLFRGQGDYIYKLEPKLFRHAYNLEQTQRRFVDMKFLDTSKKDTRTLAPDLLALLEEAQHYGVPTPLLDLSSNLLAALFFACDGFDDNSSNKDKDGALWVINFDMYIELTKLKTDNVYPYGGKVHNYLFGNGNYHYNNEKGNTFEFPIIYKPWYRELRMMIQASWFMMWGTNTKPLEIQIEKINEISFDQNLQTFDNKVENHALSKIRVPKNLKKDILIVLDTMFAISISTLAPTLDNVGKYITKTSKN